MDWDQTLDSVTFSLILKTGTMLLDNIENFYKWFFLYVFFAMLYARSAYRANMRRPADDPQKRNYPPILIVFAPVTLPLSLLVSISVFSVEALLYGLSFVVFAVGLLLAAAVSMARKAAAVFQK